MSQDRNAANPKVRGILTKIAMVVFGAILGAVGMHYHSDMVQRQRALGLMFYGFELREQGRDADAFHMLSVADALDPDLYEPKRFLGDILHEHGCRDLAIFEYKRALADARQKKQGTRSVAEGEERQLLELLRTLEASEVK